MARRGARRGPSSSAWATAKAGRCAGGPARRRRAAAEAARVGGPADGSAAHPAARPGRDRAPLRPVQRVLRAAARRAHGVLVGVLHRRRPVAARCADREARPDLPQARSAGGPAAARRRLRLGLADPATPPALRRARHRHHAVRASSATSSPSRIAEQGLADRVEVRLQDYREFDDPTAHIRRGQLDRDGRARRRGAVPRLRRDHVSARSSRAVGCCCSRCRAPRTPRRAAGRSSSPTSRRTCTCGRCGRRCAHRRTAASRCATSRRCASTTCAPSSTGSRRFEDNYDRFVALQGEEVARVWRLYLVGGALAFEQGRMGVDQILAVKS